jgi:hypothetical protein
MPVARLKLSPEQLRFLVTKVIEEGPTEENMKLLVGLMENQTGHQITKYDKLRLKTALREGVLHPEEVASAIESGSPAKISEVLRNSENQQRDQRKQRMQDRAAIQEAIGRIDVAEIGLSPAQRNEVEKQLQDGRIDPKKLLKMIDNGDINLIVDTIKEIKSEKELELLTVRSHTQDHRP